MTIQLSRQIAAARQRFREGAQTAAPASEHRTRANALTDLLWAHLDEIEAALRFAPSDWANLQRAAAAMPTAAEISRNHADAQTLRYCANTCSVTTHIRGRLREIAERLEHPAPDASDADAIREIASRRRLGLMDWERATLEAIADKLDTKDSAEDPTT